MTDNINPDERNIIAKVAGLEMVREDEFSRGMSRKLRGLLEEQEKALIDVTPDDKEKRLLAIGVELEKLFYQGNAVWFAIVEKIHEIEEGQLYEAAWNPTKGRPYNSMSEYLPDLLAGLRNEAILHKLSTRQVREYLALDKVFVRGMGIPASEIMKLGPSHFTEIREALDYNPKTGEIAEPPRPGKIGAETAVAFIEQLREAKQNGAEWRPQDFQGALDDERGVTRRTVDLEWSNLLDGSYDLIRFTLWEGGVAKDSRDGFTLEQARWLTNKFGATSNIETLGGD